MQHERAARAGRNVCRHNHQGPVVLLTLPAVVEKPYNSPVCTHAVCSSTLGMGRWCILNKVFSELGSLPFKGQGAGKYSNTV